MKFRILSALLRSSWAIDERFAMAHGGIVAGLLNGMDMDSPNQPVQKANSIPYFICADDDPEFPEQDPEDGPSVKHSNLAMAPPNSIAVIPVRGILMKEDQDECDYFQAGMDTLGFQLQEADANPNISGIILYIDSPGGTVDGTQAFAQKVNDCKKPVVAFVDGLMASAALWIGSSASVVIAQNTTTEIGSIGVKFSFADMQPKWELEGIKFHRINADQSKDKNKTYTDALAGDYKGIREQQLNPLADIFIAAVKENRPSVSESAFTGKVYFALEALSLGLIDEIGPFQQAVEKVRQLSAANNQNPQLSASQIKLTPTSQNMNVPQLTALLAVEAIESTDEGVYLSVDHVLAIENRLALDASAIKNATDGFAAQASQLAADVSAANAEKETAIAAQLQAEQDLVNASLVNSQVTASLDEIHPDIAAAADIPSKIGAIRTILSKSPLKAVGVQSASDPATIGPDGVDWAVLNALPHMQVED